MPALQEHADPLALADAQRPVHRMRDGVLMVSILSLEKSLRYILDHDQYHDFMLERQPSGGFAIMYKEFSNSEWRYVQ
jgi:hypothetical protein